MSAQSTLEADKLEATRLNCLMLSRKGQVTKAVNKATNLITEFKTDKAVNSILTSKTAEAAQKSLKVAEEKVTVLEKTNDRHNELILMLCTEQEVEDTERKIEENSIALDK